MFHPLSALQVGANSAQASLTTSVTSTALPTVADGGRPKYLYVAATAAIYVRPGPSGASYTAAQMLLLPTGMNIILNVSGATHLYHASTSGAPVVNMTPLENQ